MSMISALATFIAKLGISIADAKAFAQANGASLQLVAKIGDTTIVRVCYNEGSTNWNAFSRASRNTFYLVKGGKVTLLRMGLQRGAEIQHSGQDGQDVGGQFDPHQKAIGSAFATKGDLPSECNVLTFKADGCCLFVNYIHRSDDDALEAINQVTDNLDEMGKEFFSIVTEMSAGFDWLPVFGTNGMLCVQGEGMVATWVQALAGYAGVSVSAEKSWQDTLREALPLALPALLPLVQHLAHGEEVHVNLAFEGILAHRRDVWGNVFHNELVMDYDWSNIVFLGGTVFSALESHYVPHFEVPADLKVASALREPVYFEIGNSTEVAMTLLADVERWVKGELSKDEFFDLHPVGNDPRCLPANKAEWTIDGEGFVMLDLHNGLWHYSKLKTVLFYWLHKPRSSNLSQLVDLPERVGSVMPTYWLVRQIHALINEGGLAGSKIKILELLAALSEEDVKSYVMGSNLGTQLITALEKDDTKSQKAAAGLTNAIQNRMKKILNKEDDDRLTEMLKMKTSSTIVEDIFKSALGFVPQDVKGFPIGEQLKTILACTHDDKQKRDLFRAFMAANA